MSMPQTFTSRVNRRHEAERKAQQVRITLNTEDDETGEVTFSESYTFTRPSEGRLFLMATAFGAASRPENAASEVDATLRDMLLHEPPKPDAPQGAPQKEGEGEYLLLRRRIDGAIDKRIDIEDVMELLGSFVEYWSGFPTQPSSGSSAALEQTGGRSTGRVHSPASTPSTFPSTDSSPWSTPGSPEGSQIPRST